MNLLETTKYMHVKIVVCVRYKAECLHRYNAEKDLDKNKVMKVNENWKKLKNNQEKMYIVKKA